MIKEKKPNSIEFVLLSLRNASERYGISLNNWFWSERPDILDIKFNDFYNVIEKMEKDGLIKTAIEVKGHYCLTEKGRMALLNLKKKPYKEYYKLLSYFPDFQTNVKIENIEKFILSAIATLIFYFIATEVKIPLPNQVFATIVSLIIIALFLVAYIYSLVFISNILWSYLETLKQDTFIRFRGFLWHYRKIIVYAVLVLAYISGFLLIKFVFSPTWTDLGYVIAVGILISCIVAWNKIKDFIDSTIQKISKK